MPANLRAVAAEVVDAVVTHGQSLDAALAKHESRVADSDRSLLRMISYGTLRNYWQLTCWLDQLIKKPLKKGDRVINALIIAGLYQITEMRVPDHAVVSETVEAARRLRRPKLAGLVNACLRRFVRESIADQPVEAPTARWNHPQWLIDTLQNDWPDDWQQILQANNERAPMWLRANESVQSGDEYRQRLNEVDCAAVRWDGASSAIRLEAPVAVQELPGFAQGDVSVQDAAAQLAAPWALRGRPTRVLDACAAPGGKTGHLLEAGPAGLEVVAIDSDAARLQSVRDNLERIGRSATILAADASNPQQWWDGKPFDAILLDAPCSATGVIRRHPDIKRLRRAADIAALAKLQGRILRALWPLLAPGGRLLYVTCSVLQAENDDVIGEFLQETADAIENDVLPNNNIRDLMRNKVYGYQILPGTAELDGFYFAYLEKEGSGLGPAKVS